MPGAAVFLVLILVLVTGTSLAAYQQCLMFPREHSTSSPNSVVNHLRAAHHGQNGSQLPADRSAPPCIEHHLLPALPLGHPISTTTTGIDQEVLATSLRVDLMGPQAASYLRLFAAKSPPEPFADLPGKPPPSRA